MPSQQATTTVFFRRAAIAGALIALALLVAPGFGYQWQWWDLQTAFALFRWSAYTGGATLAAGMLTLALSWRANYASGLPTTLACLAIGAICVATPYLWQQKARSVPPIHDITTDTLSPPAFVAILPLRSDAPNPPGYAGEEVARAQRTAYPDLTTIIVDAPATRAFDAALAAARDLGWEIVATDPAGGRLEATDTTRWFGFKDDVVIRILGAENTTKIDIRSKSRVGRSDVGANAARIRDFRDKLLSSI